MALCPSLFPAFSLFEILGNCVTDALCWLVFVSLDLEPVASVEMMAPYAAWDMLSMNP